MMMNTNPRGRIRSLLVRLYGSGPGIELASRVDAIIATYKPRIQALPEPRLGGEPSEQDSILITYGDQVRSESVAPLESLADFCERHLAGVVSGIHILPFFPSSSDDGFSVIDYRAVDPGLGDWRTIERLRERFALMFDAVINHVSSHNRWFEGYLSGDVRYRDYFIAISGKPDLSGVVRPRALPLLTRFETADGPREVWTTFSADQVDLNYSNPSVLLEIIDLLLDYVSRGAELIRLDAIAYLWKEIGTACIHLPQTHAVVQLLRAVLDDAAPYVLLISETNVPHRENLTYFGDGYNEAQLVYNFALPPLILHTLGSADASALSTWARGLQTPSEKTWFFNFLASHDGIGVNPVREILTPLEIELLVRRVQEHGGLVSYKYNSDGSQSPYELNISYFDALSDPAGGEPLKLQVDRFAAAHAILCTLPGVPGIYFHSMFGSRSWVDGVQATGMNRTINRQKVDREKVEAELAEPASLRKAVFSRIKHLLITRAGSRAFHPNGEMQVLDTGPGIFGIRRFSPDGLEQVYCLHNITGEAQSVSVAEVDCRAKDLLADRSLIWTADDCFQLEPYQSVWLTV